MAEDVSSSSALRCLPRTPRKKSAFSARLLSLVSGTLGGCDLFGAGALLLGLEQEREESDGPHIHTDSS